METLTPKIEVLGGFIWKRLPGNWNSKVKNNTNNDVMAFVSGQANTWLVMGSSKNRGRD